MSVLLIRPRGFDDPEMCRKNKWIPLRAAIKNGRIKCNVKNRVNEALPIANPPQSQNTMSEPINGTAENKLVITVAPQKDICPQGSTYPKKAVAIVINKIVQPISHTCFKVWDE